MCGRISQHLEGRIYLDALQYPLPPAPDSDFEPRDARWNVPPGSQVRIIALDDGRPVMRREHWGHQGHGPRPYANARTDKANSGFWSRMWRDGRIIVPADGWYEWTGPKKNREPHFVFPADRAPLLLAAISAPDGFAIVTSEAEGGLLDVHNRRPIALTPEDARAWLEAAELEQALQIADRTLDPGAFRWHDAPKAVGSTRDGNDSPTYIEPVKVE
ncbi:MAG: yedK [Rubritepida sp.]|nr:yedK [Rubritepida sp.]